MLWSVDSRNLAAIVLLCASFAFAQGSMQSAAPPADVPAAIAAPAGLDLVLVAGASGLQIYTCQAVSDGKFAWTLKAPDAELHDNAGKVIGHHGAGPSWQLADGGKVTGKATARADSPDPDSIPWLLVNVVSHEGNGTLAKVTTIQRLHTRGGKPPAAGCDAQHKDAEAKSTYSADYYFYAAR